ncbi:MAG TPA: GNAT family N-acetyltransferase, partial [Methyloceanibacter sp.]|nr:GNAT family N-acetyltransferase [Methyloceanibacter sp.]
SRCGGVNDSTFVRIFEPIMAATLAIRSRAQSPELKKAASSIEQAAWNELGYLNYTKAHYEHYQNLLDEYPDYQLCLVDEETGYPVAVANCVPFACSDSDDLPSEGWDWVVETAARSKGARLNMLGALAISVPAVHRSKGYARVMIRALIDLAEAKGLRGLVAPVRPSAKARHPWVPISEYLSWTDPKGRVYDPWLRSHLASGGKLIGPCERSMTVNEPLGFWENWSNRRFEETGPYALEGAIAPVKIDVDRQTGTYEEPNIWVAYS